MLLPYNRRIKKKNLLSVQCVTVDFVFRMHLPSLSKLDFSIFCCLEILLLFVVVIFVFLVCFQSHCTRLLSIDLFFILNEQNITLQKTALITVEQKDMDRQLDEKLKRDRNANRK